MDELRIGGLAAALGCVARGWLEIVNSDHRLPLILINGRRAGKTLAVMAGTHGSEYVGVEAAIRLSRNLDPEELSGQVILLPLVNVDGFYGKSQYVNPTDGKNLMGVYPGSPYGSISEKIAYTITQEVIGRADYLIDLHSGDLHEDLDAFGWFAGQGPVGALSRRGMELMAAPFAAESQYEGSAMATAAQRGIPAFSPEIGGCGRWSEQTVQMAIRGVENTLRLLEILPGEPEAVAPLAVCQVAAIKTGVRGCFYPLVEIGDKVEAGQPLAKVCDLFGEPLAEYPAPEKGEIFCVTRSLAVREGDLLLGLKYGG